MLPIVEVSTQSVAPMVESAAVDSAQIPASTPAAPPMSVEALLATGSPEDQESDQAGASAAAPTNQIWQQRNRVGWRKYGRKTLVKGRGSPFEGEAAVAMYYKCAQPGCKAREVVMIPGSLETLEMVLRGLHEPGQSIVKATGSHNHELLPEHQSNQEVSFRGTQKRRRKVPRAPVPAQWTEEEPGSSMK